LVEDGATFAGHRQDDPAGPAQAVEASLAVERVGQGGSSIP
jgi:hypothetical protein